MKKNTNVSNRIKAQEICAYLCFSLVSIFLLSVPFSGQTKTLIKRTTYKNEKIDFGAGGTVTIVGAPNGSIIVEGWEKNEIEISADIEVQAETEADLARLAEINGFILDEGFGHVRILSVGTNDKTYIKRVAKKFPKHLLDKPFKIDYRIKVPAYCDLEINGGNGDLTLSKVEGAMQIRVLEGNAKIELTGGAVSAVFGSGNVDIKIASRSWRGRHADFQLASGILNVELPQNLNADIDASILRSGKIESSVAALKARQRTKFTEKSMTARAGNGGAVLSFTVGDGTLKIKN
jgi:DUF4097 and DUF4098 domain-containing protein YvlB